MAGILRDIVAGVAEGGAAATPTGAVSAVANAVTSIVERIWPDPIEREKAKAALRELEQNGELQRLTIEAGLTRDLEQTAAGDRASARQRESVVRDWVPSVLATFAILSFAAVLAALMLLPVPDGNRDAVYILLGVLGGYVGAVFTYYFGSSAGSDMKTKLLSDLRGGDK